MARNFAYLSDDDEELILRKEGITGILIAAARNFQGVAKTKNIRIHVDEPSTDTLPELDVDYQLFIQAVSNLIDNGVKYSKPGTQVTIRAERQGNQALLHFENFGIRITQRNIERVFNRFFRTNDAKRRVPSGTGIGLGVARNIIQSHGGKLYVQPSVKTSQGYKTTFTIKLPITTDDWQIAFPSEDTLATTDILYRLFD
jgi:two-component system, OmpR family, sensor histidine kinase SenX3